MRLKKRVVEFDVVTFTGKNADEVLALFEGMNYNVWCSDADTLQFDVHAPVGKQEKILSVGWSIYLDEFGEFRVVFPFEFGVLFDEDNIR